MIPIPFGYKKPDFDNQIYINKFGKFKKSWKWKNKKDEWCFCTTAYENEKKGIYKNSVFNFIKFIYIDDDWLIDNNSKNNFLYNIKEITENKKPIVIVDNELCIDILKKTNEKDFTFTTWVGNLSEIENTDFSVLKERQVFYFSNSWVFSKIVIKFFEKKLPNIIIINPVAERPGWNIYDDLPGMQLDEDIIRNYILNKETKLKEEHEIKEQEFIENIQWPFKFLGPGAGYYYFLQGECGQIFQVKQGGLNNSHLQHLAPLEFWYDNFSYSTKKGPVTDWKGAMDFVIRKINKMSPFDSNKIRGRGIWLDNNELVIHTGKRLIIGDKKIDIAQYSPNGHVYERSHELKLNIKKVKINEFEILKIKNCIDKLSIHNVLEKIYLLGWCVLGPFCGALEWRPHLWLTGPSGSGKSAIIQKIIVKLLGDFKIYVEGGTTGAGIFQRLKKYNDSFSIIHDEVLKRGKEQLEQEIEMIRSCSSTQGVVLKGTADQSGKEYTFNSMFCLSSVFTILSERSDKTRFSIINLSKNENIDWKIFRKEINETFTNEICEKVRSLFFHNWDIVKKNIDNFKDIAGVICGDQRTGDQIGTLMAGYFSFLKMKIYEQTEIQEICEKYLRNFLDDDNFLNDEIELLNKIFTSRIMYVNNNMREDTTLLNLLKRAAGTEENTPDIRCKKELYKYGINYNDKNNNIYIAYNYEWIKLLLKNTVWYNNYGNVLKRLSFADEKTKVVHFGEFYHGRAVVLDAKCVLRLSDDKIYMEAGF